MLILLRLIKSVSPGTLCSVLTDDLRRLGVASSDGADPVVLHRTPPTEHFETIARLLDRHEDRGATTADGGCEDKFGRGARWGYSVRRKG